jgi:hypothetical protein
MIWLTWRQHRDQLLIAVGLVAASAVYWVASHATMARVLVQTGAGRCLTSTTVDCSGPTQAFLDRFAAAQLLIPLLLVVPVVMGAVWGAPLVAREIEHGTHRLVWTQGTTRMRWYWTSATALVAAAAAISAAIALLTTWWSRPLLLASDDRFRPGIFDLTGVVPIGYGVFAVALGILMGAILRRTLPAVAATVGGFVAVRGLVAVVLRPRFAHAVEGSAPIFGPRPRFGLADWIVASHTVDRAGHVMGSGVSFNFTVLHSVCPELPPPGPGGPPSQAVFDACVQRAGLHLSEVYQPGSRFVAFQTIELALFVLLAATLLCWAAHVVRRRIG